MYAERNSRLTKGPASDRTHILSRQCRTECDLTSTRDMDDQSLRGQARRGQRRADFPRDYLFASRRPWGVAYEEGFPVISRLLNEITSVPGNSITRQGISLP